ncbi:hypothetical protein APED_14515 [Acanthopleuribacter pedis]
MGIRYQKNDAFPQLPGGRPVTWKMVSKLFAGIPTPILWLGLAGALK